MIIPNLGAALVSLRPGAAWTITNNELESLDWAEPDGGQERPSDAAIIAEAERLGALPPDLTPAQAHAQLTARGLLERFYGWLERQPLAMRKAFEFADAHARDGSTLTAGLAALGLSGEDIDAIFRQAF